MTWKSCGYGILGVGKFLPETVVTNADFEKTLDTSDEWIASRTGIRERRVLEKDKATSDMAIIAAERALEDAGVAAEELDLIIGATFSPDVMVPPMACLVQKRLGIGGQCAAFDLSAACTGFTYALSVATAFMRAGVYKKALVIGADTVTRSVDFSDRNTAVLFGDAAGAAVIGETGTERGLLGESLGADGSLDKLIVVHDSGSKIRTEEEIAEHGSKVQMMGRDVFKFASKTLGATTRKALEAADQGMTVDDIDLLVPHQANARIIEAAAKLAKIPMEKVFVNIHKYGNTSAATIPVALTEAVEEGRLKQGDVVAMVSFGGGMTYGASIWVW